MGIFGDIGKAVGGVAKGVSSVVSTVAKPIGKAIKPATNLIRDAAVKATEGTPLGGAVANMAKLDFAKDPLGSIAKATKENFAGSLNLAKGLVAAKVGGAVQGAVGSALKDTPLAGTGVGQAIGQSATNLTNQALGTRVPVTGGESRGGTSWQQTYAGGVQPTTQGGIGARITGAKVTGTIRPILTLGNSNQKNASAIANVAGAIAPVVANAAPRGLPTPSGPTGGSVPDATGVAGDYWDAWSSRRETVGGVIDDGVR